LIIFRSGDHTHDAHAAGGKGPSDEREAQGALLHSFASLVHDKLNDPALARLDDEQDHGKGKGFFYLNFSFVTSDSLIAD
jgi:hypothetical protein